MLRLWPRLHREPGPFVWSASACGSCVPDFGSRMGRTFRTGLQTETVSQIRRSEWDSFFGRGLKWKVRPGIWLQRGMRFPAEASSGNCIPESAPGMGRTFRNSPQPETATRNRRSERDALSLGALSGKCIPESGLGVGCTFRNGPQPETVSQNRHSERDMLSGTAFKRKLHPVLSVQAGTRLPREWLLGKRGPDRGDAIRQCVAQQPLQLYLVEPCRQSGLPDACRLQLFREHSCRADLVHGKAQQRMAVER